MNLIVTSRGKRIELFRKALGINQIPFAIKMNKSPRTISAWENGSSDPSFEHLEKMVNMGANPIFLLTGDGPILKEGIYHARS